MYSRFSSSSETSASYFSIYMQGNALSMFMYPSTQLHATHRERVNPLGRVIVVTMTIPSFDLLLTTSSEDRFLRYFLVILKCALKNFKKILEMCFLCNGSCYCMNKHNHRCLHNNYSNKDFNPTFFRAGGPIVVFWCYLFEASPHVALVHLSVMKKIMNINICVS